MKMTVCCLEPVLAPYSVPRFKAFQSLRPDYSVRVMALSAREQMREWGICKDDLGFDYVEAFPEKNVESLDSRAQAERVFQWLNALDPAAVVISGYFYSGMRAAARWTRQRKRLSIYIGDSQWGDRRRNPVKEWVKGWWARRHYDAAFAAGERAAAYLQKMGFPREKIWTGFDVVDNQVFSAGAAVARQDAAALRGRLNLPERFFLFVGRFSPEKNLPRLVEAYASYRRTAKSDAWGLILVGGGPQEKLLQQQVQGIPGVVFAGSHRADQLGLYYGLASCLILPSVSETWGLVVNEAMAAGLPVIVSHRCGCVAELVRHGLNGYVVDPFDSEGMAQVMTVMSSTLVDIASMGEISRRIMALYTPETWAKSLADCIDRTAASCRQRVEAEATNMSGSLQHEKQPI
ncbi:MAG: glycosyltransferase family 4 protein [Nitrospira sp.]|nr:MAG: glycosyltransferase family 4 protein [Nitrospira sp.]